MAFVPKGVAAIVGLTTRSGNVGTGYSPEHDHHCKVSSTLKIRPIGYEVRSGQRKLANAACKVLLQRSILCSRNNNVPQVSLARICTGVRFASSVNHTQTLPRPFSVPAVASDDTRIV